MFTRMWRRWIPEQLGRPAARPKRFRPHLGNLEERLAPAGRLFAVPNAGDFIQELNPATGAVVNSFPTPEIAPTGEVGLAFDGSHLFFLNGGATDTLYELNPDTGAVLDSDPIIGGSGGYDGLAVVAGEVYVQDYLNDQILVLDPVSDTVTRTLNLAGTGVDLLGGLAGVTGPNAVIAPVNVGGTNYIVELDPAGNITNVSALPNLPAVLGAAVVDGEIYLGSASTNTIYKFSRGGTPLGQLTSPGPVVALGGDDLPVAPGAQLVNGTFETGTTSGWRVYNASFSNGPGFQTYTGPNPQGNSGLPAPPQPGAYAAYNNQVGQGTYILYQDVALPAGQSHSLSLQAYYQNQYPGGFFTPDTLNYQGVANQQFRIDVVTPTADLLSVAANDVLVNVFRTIPGAPQSLDPTTFTADLTPFAGQTVRLRIAVANDLAFLFGAVDNVQLVSQSETPTGTLTGVEFNDLNGNGVREAGEPGLAGRVVYADLNRNDHLDTGEPTATTAADGSYALTVPPGSHVVRLAPQAGWVQTAPLASRLFAARASGSGVPETIYELDTTGAVLHSFPGPVPITFAAPQGLAASGESLFYVDGSVNGVPHTLYELDPATGAVLDSDALPPTTEIAGLAYLNGRVYVQVYQSDDILVFDPVTDTVVNQFHVTADIVGGLAGASDLGLLFATNSNGQLFAINPDTGAVVRTMPAPDALTGGLAYYRGELIAAALDPSRPAFRLDPQTGAVLGTLTLGGTGSVTALGGDGTLPAGRRATVTAGQTVGGLDFGSQEDRGTVRGVKFNDLDGDGARDAGEPGLAGWTVYADLNNNRQLDAGEPSAVTAADGTYALTLASGSYNLREVAQPGWTQTAPGRIQVYATGNNGVQLVTIDLAAGTATAVGPFGADQTYAGAFTPDGTFWTIIHGFDPSTARLARVNLATGAVTPVGGPNWTGSPLIALEADAAGTLYGGNYAGQFYRIDKATGAATPVGPLGFTNVMDFAFDNAGTLWAVDGNNQLWRVNPATGRGTFATGITNVDGGVMGLLVDPRTGTLYATTYADTSALFTLNPATGVATRVGSTLGTPLAHGGDIGLLDSHLVTVTAGAILDGRDFGNQRDQGTVSGVLFNDLNANGVRDAGEPALAGRTVYADLNNNRTPDAGEPSAVTAADGSYALTLPAGSYRLRTVVPTGWRQTAPTAGSFFSVRIPAGSGAPVVYEMNASGAVIGSFPAPGPVLGVGAQGLADAGGSLFYVDGSGQGPHTLYELDSVTGAVIDSDTLPATPDIAGLAFLDGLVYAQIYPTEQILVFDPVTDTVLRTMDVAADIIGGLAGAWDRGLLYGSNNNGVIYGIDPATGAVVQTLFPPNVGPLWGGLAYLNGELIAVPITDSGPAFRVNPDTGAVLGTITLGGIGAVSALGGDGANAPYRVAVTPGSALAGRDFGTRQNAAPVAVDDAASVTEDVMLGPPPPGVLGNDTDADPHDSKVVVAVNGSTPVTGQTITLPSGARLTMRADGGYLYDQNGQFNYLPTGQTATDSFTYTVRDGRGATATATVTITIVGANDRPFANDESYSLDEGAVFTVSAPGLLGNDADPDGDPLSAVLVSEPSHGNLTLNADGSFTYTPAANYNGPDSFAYRASDGSLSSNIATVLLTVYPVNDAPVAAADAYATDEDTALPVSAPGLLGNDTDVDGDPIHAVLVSGPAHGSLALNGDGSFTYTPAADFNGTDSFTYKANDGAADSNVASVTITVRPANDVPVARNDSYSTDEDTALTVGTPGVLGNDTDADGDPLRAVLVSGPAHGTLALSADGSFTYTPAANYNGSDSFTYKANDGTSDSNVATVSLMVRSVNDAPVAAADAYATDEDTALTVASPGILGNDSDADGDNLRAVLVSGPSHGSVALNADGSFTYTPLADFNGTDSFTYKANDGALDSNVATVTLTVRPVNDVPVARDDAYSTDEDTALTVAAPGVLGNDTDADGDALTAALASGPSHGSLALNPDGSFAYTPAANFNGADSFTYRASDGTATSDPVTVSLTVRSVNDVPVARDDAYATDEDTALTVGTPGVLGNDSDVDGDALHAVLVSGPSHGSLALNADGSFTYTPQANFNGSDSFTYKANDGQADSNLATVFLTVRPVNDAPVARDDAYATDEDAALTVSAPGPLGNDSDADGDSLSAALVSGPAHGTLALNADGSFTYTPASNFNGTDSFSYRASDGTATSGVAAVTITVRPVNDVPVAASDAYAMNEDTALTVATPGVLGNDTDADGNALSAVLVSGPAHGTLALSADGSFSYTPVSNFNGTDSFTYKANDGTADSNVAAVTLTVRPRNDAPVAVNDAYTLAEDTTLTVLAAGVLGNDTDLDGDNLTAVLVSGPSHGTVAVNADGSFTYTPAANYNGSDGFTYKANDGTADSNVATVSLTVTAVPDVARVEVNQGAVQRSRVTQIAVTFDSVVTLLPGAFTLTRASDGLGVGMINVTTTTVGGRTVATLTFAGVGTEFGSLADGRWTLTVVAANVRGSNGATMAADSTTGLTRLFGDADGDGDVDSLDEAKFNAAFGRKLGQAGYVSYFDFDQDGRIDPKDRTQFRQRLGTRV